MTDVTIIGGGSITLLQPETNAAREWFEENISQDNGYQPYWPTIVCEGRYVTDILEGMANDGLNVETPA